MPSRDHLEGVILFTAPAAFLMCGISGFLTGGCLRRNVNREVVPSRDHLVIPVLYMATAAFLMCGISGLLTGGCLRRNVNREVVPSRDHLVIPVLYMATAAFLMCGISGLLTGGCLRRNVNGEVVLVRGCVYSFCGHRVAVFALVNIQAGFRTGGFLFTPDILGIFMRMSLQAQQHSASALHLQRKCVDRICDRGQAVSDRQQVLFRVRRSVVIVVDTFEHFIILQRYADGYFFIFICGMIVIRRVLRRLIAMDNLFIRLVVGHGLMLCRGDIRIRQIIPGQLDDIVDGGGKRILYFFAGINQFSGAFSFPYRQCC